MASSLQYSAHKSSSKENGQYKAKHKTKNYQFLPQGESTRIDEDKKIPSDTRIILRINAFHESYRLLLYSRLYILNHTDLKLIENNRTLINVIHTQYLVFPKEK
ncbi:unnamed protein product [Rotaria sordida]|uniref:Uncharacterized protein n=2 Tax=Rotaria sordida TaxID=392033 RepID=A0A815H6I2_9BILA|nr:unnamed protein product [Rotaria sordida]CAF1600105.1 unnamed protein product [Rotaria sordida]